MAVCTRCCKRVRKSKLGIFMCRLHGPVRRAEGQWLRRMIELGWPEETYRPDSIYARWNQMSGTIGILNVGAGDTKLTFDKDKPEDRERAAKAVADMIKRGYAIMVQVGENAGKPLYQRCDAFDADTCEYVIMGVPPDLVDVPDDMKRADPPEVADAPAADVSAMASRKRGRRTGTRVKAEGASAVGIARSAGG